MSFWIQSFSIKLLITQFSQIVKLCLQLDNQRDLPRHRAAMLLLISLGEVELLLINVHFSYARAAHGMFCPLSYALVKSLYPHLSVHYFNIAIRLWTYTTLTTSGPGEQNRCNIAKTLLCPPTCCFQQFELLFCFLLIFLFIHQQLQLLFFLKTTFFINEGSTIIGQAVVVSLPLLFLCIHACIKIVFQLGEAK